MDRFFCPMSKQAWRFVFWVGKSGKIYEKLFCLDFIFSFFDFTICEGGLVAQEISRAVVYFYVG